MHVSQELPRLSTALREFGDISLTSPPPSEEGQAKKTNVIQVQ